MIMGVSGGALITPLMGIVADGFGQVAGLSILLLCILYICIISLESIKIDAYENALKPYS